MLPSKAYARNAAVDINVFKGLNRRIKSETGEFFDMENAGHGDFPCLSSIKNSKVSLNPGLEIIKYIIPRYAAAPMSGFTGIAKNAEGKFELYIGGECKKAFDEYTDAVDFNGTIFVFPAFMGYNYVMSSGSESDKWIFPAGVVNCVVSLARIWETKSGSMLIEKTYDTVSKNLSEGLSVSFSGFTGEYEVNNTIYPANSTDYSNLKSPVSITITKIKVGSGSSSSNPLTQVDFIMRNAKGEKIMPHAGNVDDGRYGDDISGIDIDAYMPKAEHFCVSQNRLWICDSSGEKIQASALGRPIDFFDLGTSASGGWYGEVGTPGHFTGIIGLQNRVIAFKEDSMHIVYGSNPLEYSIEKTYTTGCIDKNSLCAAGNMVIWLYHDGFYSYSGGAPRRISEKLNTRYVSAVAFADNVRYYARCVREDGEAEFLIYDTEYGFWTKISDMQILGGEFYGGKVYAYDREKVYELFGGEYGDFYAETTEMWFDSFDEKSVIYALIRCRIKDGGFLNLYTSANGGEWVPHKGISAGGKHKLPIRYSKGDTLRLRFEGHGEVALLDVEMELKVES